ncbi:threonine/serine exporter ThrE family protein [Kytococcus sedentarius]|uniref:threonine/serine ThrE exporter family protein n=1 Tax=Kytococcus sedentarius TaxID=1276 RepID=UPI0035BBC4E6
MSPSRAPRSLKSVARGASDPTQALPSHSRIGSPETTAQSAIPGTSTGTGGAPGTSTGAGGAPGTAAHPTAAHTTHPAPVPPVTTPGTAPLRASSVTTGQNEAVVLAPGVQEQLAPGTIRGGTRRRAIRLADVVRPSKASASPLVDSGDRDLDERRGRHVIDLALRTGEALLAAGTPAADVVATLLRLTSAFGVRSAHVDITFTSITVSIHRGMGEDPLSVMRVVRARTPDYMVVERLQAFVNSLATAPDDLDAASARLEEILHAPRAYRPWVASGSLAMMGAAVSALLGADWVTWILTFFSALFIDQTISRLGRWGLPPFFGQVVAAAIPTTVAVAIYAIEKYQLTLGPIPLDPPGDQYHSLIVAAGIIVLLAGLGVVGTAQDALDGYYVTAGARAFEVVVMTAGVAIGVSLVLSAAQRAGLSMTILTRPYLSDHLPTLVVSSAVFCFFSAIATYASMRAAVLSSMLGATAFAVYWAVDAGGISYEMRVLIAVAFVSFLAQWVARVLHVPSLALTTAVIAPFLPGGMVYRGLFLLMDNDPDTYFMGIQQILSAVASGLALAAGVSLGTWIYRAVNGMSRSERKASRVVET